MKKQKKLVVFSMLIAFTCLVLLTACGNNDGAPSEPGVSTGNNDGAPSEPDASKGGDGEPQEINVLLSHLLAEYAMEYKAPDPYVEELSRLSGYNLNIEFLGHASDFNQQLTVRFASGDLPDLIRTPSILAEIHPGAVELGVFKELGPLIDEYAPSLKNQFSDDVWNHHAVSYDGRIYGIPTKRALDADRVTYIRQDWLDQLDMEQPRTNDEYLAFFEAVKQNDMNGNGDPNDEYGYYVRETAKYGEMFFMSTAGVFPNSWDMIDGQMTPGIIRPEMKEALKFYKMLYDEGYINRNLFTTSGGDWISGIVSGIAGSWIHHVPNYLSTWNTSNFTDPNAELSMIETPTGPGGQGIVPKYLNMGYKFVIPAEVSDEKAIDIIKFFEWVYSSEEADRFFAYGVEDQNYTRENGEINWDEEGPENDPNEVVFYQFLLNPRGDGRLSPLVIAANPEADALENGIRAANTNVFQHDSLNMPTLDAFETNPELVPGTGSGTLFLDMFANIITGNVDLDEAFDNFVDTWKSRGGEKAMTEATEWYNNQ